MSPDHEFFWKSALCMALLGCGVTDSILATPCKWSTTKPLPWEVPAEGSKTIKVFIQRDVDSDPPEVSELLKEGILRWNAELAERGLQLDVVIGDPPPPPDAPVVVEYKPVGYTFPEDRNADPFKLGRDNDGAAGTMPFPKRDDRSHIGSASVVVQNDIWAASAGWYSSEERRMEFIRNLGQHEICHALGLSDDEDGVVTNHEQSEFPNAFNDTDRKEIGMLYPKRASLPSKADGQTQGSLDPHEYRMRFTYVGPPDGHVALISFAVDASLIDHIECPAGWICLNPASPEHLDRHSPFYQDYMEDVVPSLAPWDPASAPGLALRALTTDSALSADNPQLEFSYFALLDRRGSIEAWAGGEIQYVEGPIPRGLSLAVDGACPGTVRALWTGAASHATLGLVFGLNQGSTTIPDGPCRGTVLGVSGGVRLIRIIGSGNGSGSVNGSAGQSACGRFLQLVQAGTCTTSNVAQIP